MTKTVTKNELQELIWNDDSKKVDEWPTKHDSHGEEWLVYDEGKPYLVSFETSYQWGMDDGPFDLEEAEECEVTEKKWRRKV